MQNIIQFILHLIFKRLHYTAKLSIQYDDGCIIIRAWAFFITYIPKITEYSVHHNLFL